MRTPGAGVLLLSLLIGVAAGYPTLDQEPDFESLYRRAVAARLAGRPGDAVGLLERLARAEPENADIPVQLGFAQIALGDLDAAKAAFGRALSLAPAYADAHLGLAQIALWRGSLAEAATEAQVVLAGRADAEAEAVLRQARAALARQRQEHSKPTPQKKPQPHLSKPGRGRPAPGGVARKGSPPAASRAASKAAAQQDRPAAAPEAAPVRWRIDLDGSFSRLSRGFDDWREGTARIGYELRPGTVLSAASELSERFGRSDLYLEARIDHRLDETLSLYAYAGGTPQADYRPTFAYGAGGAWRVSEGLHALGPSVATLDISDAVYRNDRVAKLSPGLVQYLFDGRAWITARWINAFDESGHAGGYALRTDLQLGERLTLFSGASQAPESSDGVRIDIVSFFAGGTVSLSDRTLLRFSYTFEDRSRGYDRSVYAFGVGVRF